jgi:uncharacterized membrane protein
MAQARQLPLSERFAVKDLWDTGRTEAFSDGVFAVAITLLVFDLAVPSSQFDHLWRALADQWPAYMGYATSFLTVGGIWLVHQAMFRRLRYVNKLLMEINLVLLMAVGILPFPTRLMAEALTGTTSAERAAVVFYGASLLVIRLLLTAFWAVAARNRDLLEPEVSEQEARAILHTATPNIGFFVAAIVLAIFAPKVAAFGYLLIAIFALVRARGDRTLPPTTASA